MNQRPLHLVLALIAISLIPIPAEAEPGIKLALVTSLSGPAAIHGQSIRKGVELACQELAGQGWKVDLAVEDDQSNPAKTVTAVTGLANRGYRFFIGPTWSYLVESVAPIYQRQGLVAIAPAVSSDVVGSSAPGLFYGLTPVDKKAEPLARWFLREKIKRAVVLYANSRWGSVHEEVFRKAAAQAGVTIAAVETFEYGQEDSSIRPIITRLNRLHPDAYLTTSSKEGAAEMNRALLELKAATRLLSTEDIEDAAKMNILPKSSPGVSRWSISYRVDAGFVKRFSDAYQEIPYMYADSAYDAALIFAQAIQHSGANVDGVSSFIKGIDYQGASGHWRFDDKGDVVKQVYEIIEVKAE